MTQVNQPSVSVTRLSATAIAGLTEQKILIVGQKVAGGTAVDGELNENILNLADNDTLAGANSIGAAMYRRARAVNPIGQIDAIYLDDNGSAVDAEGTFTFTGAGTADGSLTFYVGSKNEHRFTIATVDLDTPASLAEVLKDAINASTTVNVLAVASIGVVTLTALNGGTIGNTIPLSFEGSAPGISVAIVAMASGAADPDLSNVLSPAISIRYQGIIWQFEQDLTELTDFLDPRFSSTDEILDGVGFVSITDSLSNVLATLGAENSASLSIHCDKILNEPTITGSAIVEIPCVKVAEFAAIRALRRTENANIAAFVITSNGRDAIGGPASNSKPYFNTPLPFLEVITDGFGWTRTEIEQITAAGGWVMGNNRARNGVITGEVVTTRTTNAAGIPDNTFFFLNAVDTSSALAEFYSNNFSARYAQFRLVSGALIPDRDSANTLSIRGFSTQLNQLAGGSDFALTQIGDGELNGEQVDLDKFYVDNLVVTIDLSVGKTTVTMISVIVVQARTFLIPITITSSPEG